MFTYTNSKGVAYILHERSTSRGGTIRFFSREQKEGAVEAKPAGFIIVESKTGLPMLKRTEPVSRVV